MCLCPCHDGHGYSEGASNRILRTHHSYTHLLSELDQVEMQQAIELWIISQSWTAHLQRGLSYDGHTTGATRSIPDSIVEMHKLQNSQP